MFEGRSNSEPETRANQRSRRRGTEPIPNPTPVTPGEWLEGMTARDECSRRGFDSPSAHLNSRFSKVLYRSAGIRLRAITNPATVVEDRMWATTADSAPSLGGDNHLVRSNDIHDGRW